MIWLPNSLYENLPKLYFVLAILGIYSPESYGRFCGTILIVAAYHIHRMRKAARTNVVTGVKK